MSDKPTPSEAPELTAEELAVISYYRTFDEETKSLLIGVIKHGKPLLVKSEHKRTRARAFALYGQLVLKGILQPPDFDCASDQELLKLVEEFNHTITMLEVAFEASIR